MMHRSRRFSVVDVSTADELAVMLTGHIWCSCTGFHLIGSDLLFLNDSTSPDGAQEYAIVRDTDRRQIESITFGWCSEAQALRYLTELMHGTLGQPSGKPVTNVIESPTEHGRCGYCA